MPKEILTSYKKYLEIFSWIKALHLRANFWEQVVHLQKEYEYLQKFPLKFFLKFEKPLDELFIFLEDDLENILKIDIKKYIVPSDLEFHFTDFKELFFNGTPYTDIDYHRIKKFLNSNRRNDYTIEFIKNYVVRSQLWLSIKSIEKLEKDEKEYKKQKKILEAKIRTVIQSIQDIKTNQSVLKTGIDSVLSEQQKLFMPEQLKLFNVPPKNIHKQLFEYKRLGELINKLGAMKNELETKYIDLL